MSVGEWSKEDTKVGEGGMGGWGWVELRRIRDWNDEGGGVEEGGYGIGETCAIY